MNYVIIERKREDAVAKEIEKILRRHNMNNELVQKIDSIVETLKDLRGHL
jgi:hypothetical protein